MKGYWREMDPARQPAALVAAGLGATPMRSREGRWYARQVGFGGAVRALYFAGLGDASSDLASANSQLAAGGQLISGTVLDTSNSDSDRDTAAQQAVGKFLQAATGYQTVAADVGQPNLVDSYVSTIQTIQGSLNGDLTADSANAANAQTAALSAQALVTPIVTSNKGSGGGGSGQGQGGGGGGGGGGQPPTPTPQPPTPAPITTTTSGTNWWPWAIAAGVGVGAVAIGVAMHKKKKRLKK